MIKKEIQLRVSFFYILFLRQKKTIYNKKNMKNFSKIILTFVIIVALFTSCVYYKKLDFESYALGTSMEVAYHIEQGSKQQLDSIITVDNLPNFRNWLYSEFSDYETGRRISKKTCIVVHEDGREIVYIVVGLKEPYKITKRIRK
jgi:hypothetical protein